MQHTASGGSNPYAILITNSLVSLWKCTVIFLFRRFHDQWLKGQNQKFFLAINLFTSVVVRGQLAKCRVRTSRITRLKIWNPAEIKIKLNSFNIFKISMQRDLISNSFSTENFSGVYFFTITFYYLRIYILKYISDIQKRPNYEWFLLFNFFKF